MTRAHLLVLAAIALAVSALAVLACQSDKKFGAINAPGAVMNMDQMTFVEKDAAVGAVFMKGDAGFMVLVPATVNTSLPVGGHLSGTTADATETSEATTAITVAGGVNGQVLTYTDAGVMAKTVSPAASGVYVPAIVANWADAAPATIQAALDRIAAKSHPIP